MFRLYQYIFKSCTIYLKLWNVETSKWVSYSYRIRHSHDICWYVLDILELYWNLRIQKLTCRCMYAFRKSYRSYVGVVSSLKKSYKSPVEYHGVVYGLKGYTKFLSHKKDTKLIAPKCLTKIEFKYFI